MKDTINKFLKDRPACTIKGIAREVGVSHQAIDYIRKGVHNASPGLQNKLNETFKKYGWDNG
jgi:predicted transcriptional regulator